MAPQGGLRGMVPQGSLRGMAPQGSLWGVAPQGMGGGANQKSLNIISFESPPLALDRSVCP
jgi:hypothetical protein